MRDRLEEILIPITDPIKRLNRGREYLQEFILYILFLENFSRNLIFEGGTALRILYRLGRFSEDLDFSLARSFNLSALATALREHLYLTGYDVEVVEKRSGALFRIRVKFSQLEEVLMLPKGKKFTITLEIDLSPPSGGRTERTLAGREFRFWLIHYDLSSLFAKKLHAVLFRDYEKGRDFYDLLWYLTRGTHPNEELLLNAVSQTHPQEVKKLRQAGWKEALLKKLQRVDFSKLQRDLLPFLENPSEVKLLTRENLLHALQSYNKT